MNGADATLDAHSCKSLGGDSHFLLILLFDKEIHLERSVDLAVSELVVSGPAFVIQSSNLEEIGRLQMVP